MRPLAAKSMKIILIIAVFLLGLSGCHQPEKRKAVHELERSEEKLSVYRQTVESLNQDLAKLQHQLEVAEDNIIINLVKEFRMYRTKKERAKRIEQAVATKEDVEENIENTILKINTFSDSLQTTEQKISQAKATLND